MTAPTNEPVRQVRDILMVEDSQIIRSFFVQSIEQSGAFRVTTCSTMAETQALLDAGEKAFFAAVLDLNLPDAPEGQAVDLVLVHSIPSIVLTSLIDEELRERIEAKGVLDYVLKSGDATRQVLSILERLVKNRGVCILVVEDSSLMRNIMRDHLSRFGFEVLEAKNGKEGLELLKSRPDIPLVITDYEMPEMNGFELCEAIRADKSKNELAIIGISSYENKLLSARLIKAGANDFLTKPFQREELYTRIVQNLETLDYIERINHSLETISKMHQRMKHDLDAAAALQRSLLPASLPQVRGVKVASKFFPCDELAGDTYNIFAIDDDHLGVFLIDVSGHGVPSALLSVTLTRLLEPGPESLLLQESGRFCRERMLSPAEVCNRLNARFPMNPDTFQYFTIVYGILDLRSRQFRFASAGHPGPVHVHPGRQSIEHHPLNMAIGFSPDARYSEDIIDLAPGDMLFFYTDGLVEAMNESGEEFGSGRLCRLLQALAEQELEATLQSVYDCASEWSATSFKDDVTICSVALEKNT